MPDGRGSCNCMSHVLRKLSPTKTNVSSRCRSVGGRFGGHTRPKHLLPREGPMPPMRGPAVPRRRLGSELRRLREESGLLIEDVAETLECSTSKISRLENGKGIPKIRDVRDMLGRYGVTDSRL